MRRPSALGAAPVHLSCVWIEPPAQRADGQELQPLGPADTDRDKNSCRKSFEVVASAAAETFIISSECESLRTPSSLLTSCARGLHLLASCRNHWPIRSTRSDAEDGLCLKPCRR